MFKINPKPTFKSEVQIPVPGETKPGVLTFEFKHKGRKALRAFFESLSTMEGEKDEAKAMLDLIVGWEGVDEKFSEEALATLLDNYPGSGKAIVESYHEALLSGRVKN